MAKVFTYAQPALTVTISPGGALHFVEQWESGKREVRSGQLSDEQLRELSAEFREWGQLNSSYPIRPDGSEYTITYDGKTVTAGDDNAPQSLDRARRRIMDLAYRQPRRAG